MPSCPVLHGIGMLLQHTTAVVLNISYNSSSMSDTRQDNSTTQTLPLTKEGRIESGSLDNMYSFLVYFFWSQQKQPDSYLKTLKVRAKKTRLLVSSPVVILASYLRASAQSSPTPPSVSSKITTEHHRASELGPRRAFTLHYNAKYSSGEASRQSLLSQSALRRSSSWLLLKSKK